MQRIADPILETLDLVRARKQITLPALAYRLGLSQKDVKELLKILEQEKAIELSREGEEIVIRSCPRP